MNRCYLLISRQEWETFQGDLFFPPNFVTEGFIHLCLKDQIEWVANSFLKGVDNLMALELDLQPVKEKVQWSDVPGVGSFPHLHAGLPRDRVVGVIPLHRDAAGNWRLV